jgi:hypothetical protein
MITQAADEKSGTIQLTASGGSFAGILCVTFRDSSALKRLMVPLSGRLLLAVFIVLQVADGLMTFQAVALFGLAAEGNPLLATWMMLVGAGPALFGAKFVACACAAFLHRCGCHRVLAGLATVYVLLAVGPWLHFLTVFASHR